jgi:hypothetical protein
VKLIIIFLLSSRFSNLFVIISGRSETWLS